MGTQPTKNNPKSHKFTKLKNWAHQTYQQIQLKTRFTNTLRALLITRRSKIYYNPVYTINYPQQFRYNGTHNIFIKITFYIHNVPSTYNSPHNRIYQAHTKKINFHCIPPPSQQISTYH